MVFVGLGYAISNGASGVTSAGFWYRLTAPRHWRTDIVRPPTSFATRCKFSDGVANLATALLILATAREIFVGGIDIFCNVAYFSNGVANLAATLQSSPRHEHLLRRRAKFAQCCKLRRTGNSFACMKFESNEVRAYEIVSSIGAEAWPRFTSLDTR